MATGKAQWKTLKQGYTEWETNYNAQMFQWECGQIAQTGIVKSTSELIKVYPNPATDYIKFEGIKLGTTLKIYNSNGALVYHSKIKAADIEIDITQFSKGVYFYLLNDMGITKSITGKFLVK